MILVHDAPAGLPATAYARTLLDDVDAATARATLGLGTADVPTFLAVTLTGGTLTTSTPGVSLTQTWNNALTPFKAFTVDITDTASASGSLLMDLRVGGSSMFRVDKVGNIGDPAAPSQTIYAVNYRLAGQARITSSADGVVVLYNDASSDFGRLCFGGTSASEPAIKKTGTGLAITTASNSNYARLTALDFVVNGGHLFFDDNAILKMGNTTDTGLARNAAGTVEINNGTLGTYRDLIARNLELTGSLKFGTHSALGAETVTGYVTITDAAGNSRKLAVVS